MPRVSEEMKQLSAVLGNELNTWPKVTTRPMFGLRGFYRGKNIFAALPVTRAIKNPNSLIFRIQTKPTNMPNEASQWHGPACAGRLQAVLRRLSCSPGTQFKDGR